MAKYYQQNHLGYDELLIPNILPYSPGSEERLAAEALKYRNETGFNFVLYCLTCDVEGVPAEKKIDDLCKSFRRFRLMLEGKGMRVGILLQSIVGHWQRHETESEPWTRMRGIDGHEGGRRCILDHSFAAYVKETAAKLAYEKPAFILADDDIRVWSYNGEECFCDLHTAEFAKRTGRSSCTSEEMREAVKVATRGSKDEKVFRELQRELINGVCKLIREGIDSVDPSIPSGVCMPVAWDEPRFYGQAARAIAGTDQPTVMRIGNGQYLEREPKTVVYRVMTAYEMAEAHPYIDYLLDEADTYPQTLWSRSSCGMAAKIAMSLMAGFRGALLWYAGSTRNGFPVHENYTKALAANAGRYRELAGIVGEKGRHVSKATGVAIPFFSRFPALGSRFIESDNWGDAVCAAFGVPFRCESNVLHADPEQIFAIAGRNSAERYTDDELNSLFRCRLLIDSKAAEVLTLRGYAALMGVSASSEDKPQFIGEYSSDNSRRYMLSGSSDVAVLKDADPAAETLTYLGWAPYDQSPEIRHVAPATTFYINKLGGHVVVSTWHPQLKYGFSGGSLSEGRRHWFLDVLDRLNDGMIPFAADHDQDFLMQAREMNDGSTVLLAANLNYDPVPELRIRIASKQIPSVEILADDGTWIKTMVRRDGDVLVVPGELKCYGFRVLRIS